MSTILDALAKAKQTKEQRVISTPGGMSKPSRHRGKGRSFFLLIPAVLIFIAGTGLVYYLRPHWAEPLLNTLGKGKKAPAVTPAASKPSPPPSMKPTASQKPEEAQPQGFLEILMKSNDKSPQNFSSKITADNSPKDDVSEKKMPLFLQKLQKMESAEKSGKEKPSPPSTAENPFARLLKQQQQKSGEKSGSSPGFQDLAKKIETADKGSNVAGEFFNQGVDFEQEGKLAQAISAYQNAVASDKSFERAYINLGNLYLNYSKNPQQAISMYSRALEYSPENPKAINNIGAAYMALKEFDKAESEFLKAVNLDPQFVDPLYNLACLFARKEDVASALSWLEKAYTLGGEEIISWATEDQDLEIMDSYPEYHEFLKKTQSNQENLEK